MAKDLVCGMQVDEMYPPVRIMYRGEEYFFCCKECLEAFEKEPDRYIEREEDRKN